MTALTDKEFEELVTLWTNWGYDEHKRCFSNRVVISLGKRDSPSKSVCIEYKLARRINDKFYTMSNQLTRCLVLEMIRTDKNKVETEYLAKKVGVTATVGYYETLSMFAEVWLKPEEKSDNLPATTRPMKTMWDPARMFVPSSIPSSMATYFNEMTTPRMWPSARREPTRLHELLSLMQKDVRTVIDNNSADGSTQATFQVLTNGKYKTIFSLTFAPDSPLEVLQTLLETAITAVRSARGGV